MCASSGEASWPGSGLRAQGSGPPDCLSREARHGVGSGTPPVSEKSPLSADQGGGLQTPELGAGPAVSPGSEAPPAPTPGSTPSCPRSMGCRPPAVLRGPARLPRVSRFPELASGPGHLAGKGRTALPRGRAPHSLREREEAGHGAAGPARLDGSRGRRPSRRALRKGPQEAVETVVRARCGNRAERGGL